MKGYENNTILPQTHETSMILRINSVRSHNPCHDPSNFLDEHLSHHFISVHVNESIDDVVDSERDDHAIPHHSVDKKPHTWDQDEDDVRDCDQQRSRVTLVEDEIPDDRSQFQMFSS